MDDASLNSARRRAHLPPRRPSETRRLQWAGRTIFVTVGYDPADGAPKEIFYAGGYRGGSDMEVLVSDLCIALSVMLQHEGVSVATLGKSMSETFDILTGESAPASVLGVLLDELSRPPGFAGLLAEGEGTDADPAVGTGNSGAAGDVEDPASGEAGRRDPTPGPAGAARHEHQDGAPDAAASGEKAT